MQIKRLLTLAQWVRQQNKRKTVSGAARAIGMTRRHLQMYWRGERAFPMSAATVAALAKYLGVHRRTVQLRFAPAGCIGCAAKDRRIAELEGALADARRQLEAVRRVAA